MRRTTPALIAALILTGGGWVVARQAQVPFGTPGPSQDIRTGSDLGFRVRDMKDGRALGTLMVRTKSGEWVEAVPAPTRGFVVPLESQ